MQNIALVTPADMCWGILLMANHAGKVYVIWFEGLGIIAFE